LKLKNARLTYQPKKKYGGAENKQPVKYAFPGITVVNVDHKLIANPEACEKNIPNILLRMIEDKTSHTTILTTHVQIFNFQSEKNLVAYI